MVKKRKVCAFNKGHISAESAINYLADGRKEVEQLDGEPSQRET